MLAVGPEFVWKYGVKNGCGGQNKVLYAVASLVSVVAMYWKITAFIQQLKSRRDELGIDRDRAITELCCGSIHVCYCIGQRENLPNTFVQHTRALLIVLKT